MNRMTSSLRTRLFLPVGVMCARSMLFSLMMRRTAGVIGYLRAHHRYMGSTRAAWWTEQRRGGVAACAAG